PTILENPASLSRALSHFRRIKAISEDDVSRRRLPFVILLSNATVKRASQVLNLLNLVRLLQSEIMFLRPWLQSESACRLQLTPYFSGPVRQVSLEPHGFSGDF